MDELETKQRWRICKITLSSLKGENRTTYSIVALIHNVSNGTHTALMCRLEILAYNMEYLVGGDQCQRKTGRQRWLSDSEDCGFGIYLSCFIFMSDVNFNKRPVACWAFSLWHYVFYPVLFTLFWNLSCEPGVTHFALFWVFLSSLSDITHYVIQWAPLYWAYYSEATETRRFKWDLIYRQKKKRIQ